MTPSRPAPPARSSARGPARAVVAGRLDLRRAHRARRASCSSASPAAANARLRAGAAHRPVRAAAVSLPGARHGVRRGAASPRPAPCVAVALVRAGRQQPLWLPIVFALALVLGLLVWATAGAGQTLTVPGLLAGSLGARRAADLRRPRRRDLRAGRRGQRRHRGPAARRRVRRRGRRARSPARWCVGLLAAMVAGMLVSFVLAAFAIKYLVDQVIVGVVLNVLVLGLTNFLYTLVLVPASATLNSPPSVHPIAIPLLSAIPVIGPVLFQQTVIVYLMYVGVAAVTSGCSRHEVGPAAPRGRRAPAGRGHRRHQASGRHAVLERRARGRDRRPRRRVLDARGGAVVHRRRHERRRLHRPRRGDLRAVEPGAGDARRPAVRLRQQPAERARASWAAPCRPTSC